MSSKNGDKGTCELNKHDISLINEDREFHEQEGITFSMLLKVRCYVQMAIIVPKSTNICCVGWEKLLI